jgi:hypothetical protein
LKYLRKEKKEGFIKYKKEVFLLKNFKKLMKMEVPIQHFERKNLSLYFEYKESEKAIQKQSKLEIQGISFLKGDVRS